jgi:hypothetical protein
LLLHRAHCIFHRIPSSEKLASRIERATIR